MSSTWVSSKALNFLHAPQRVKLGFHGRLAQTLPIVEHVDQPSADVIRFLGSQKQSKIDLLIGRDASGQPHLLGFFQLAPPCAFPAATI